MSDEPTHQPERAIMGFCPECKRVVIIFNDHEVWPLAKCVCGWRGATTEIPTYTRYERGGFVSDLWGEGRRQR